ncbi:uncharacterized protein [Elaeis guineensis]|uniref:Uncharacterized protein LOC105060158 isoform X2 n=1 Tax=Elaeis guineensis var. tenera TaxID=51953 RepID=A0A6I9SM09_ELAGV|nr:uncharacterized protein LOC105060158 isoform X2 [Elaeis guineensis]
MEPSLPSHSSKSFPFPLPSSSRARAFPALSDTEPFFSFSSLPNPNPIRRSFSDVSASAPVDYGYRAAEDRDPLLFFSSSSASTTTNSYFTEQALRAGYIDVGGDIRRGDFTQPITSREALQRELEKERIREELIARDIARRRILEEEVRRELELERAMATRRLQLEDYSSVPEAMAQHPEAGLEHGMQFGPAARIADRFGAPRVPTYPEDRVHEWSSPPPHHPEPVMGRKLPLPQQQPEVSPFRKITPAKPNLSGMKRKSVAVTGGHEHPRPPKKEWSCALCQVSATSKQGLDEHLEGKKHKANLETLVEGKKPKATEAQLHAKKIIKTKKAVGSTSVTKVTGKSLPTEGASTNGPVKNQREDKKQQTVQQKRYCCDLCKVKCNSEVMLASHLRGKKHIAQLEGSKKDGKPVMPASAGKKVKANQRAKREEPENTEFAEVAKLFD